MSDHRHALRRQTLYVILPPVVDRLCRDLQHHIPPAGPFPEARVRIPLSGCGPILHLTIIPLDEAGRRALALESMPADRSHHSTRYLCRGTNQEILVFLEATSPEQWIGLLEDACDRFYYP